MSVAFPRAVWKVDRRMADLDGTWKVCSKVGESCYLDACGVPEPMKVSSTLHPTPWRSRVR